MSAKFKEALPDAGDFFDDQQAVTDRLRAIGNTEYQQAFKFGDVRDPVIDEVIFNPELASIWREAQRQARLDKRELKVALEPVFDEGGSLVGSRPTGDVIPDVETLHSFKRQLDTAITAAFRRGAGDEGTSLKKLREQMVNRLDALVPDYKIARGKYRGDLEVRKAMDDGLKILSSTVQAKQLRKSFTAMSDAEKEAFKTGALEAVTRNIDGSKGGNLANRLAGAKANIEKFEALMGPEEAKFFKRIIAKEDQLYQRTSKITGGSRTTPLAQGLDALDDMIQKGNLGEVVNLLMAGPTGILPAFGRFVSKFNLRKEFGDQVYTKLSRALSAQKPEELREVLDMLRRSKSYTDYMTSVKNTAAGRVAAVTGATAPSMFDDRSFIPPPPAGVEQDPETLLANELASGGLGTAIGDGAAMDEAAMQEGTAAEEQAPEQGTIMIGDREAQMDADGRFYYVDDNTPADGIPMGMYRGGTVQAFGKGGNKGKPKDVGYDYANALRTLAQGASFGTADEAEGYVSSLLSGRSYEDERDERRRLIERYALANPNTALALEGAGMIGGSLLMPSLGATRMVASAPRLARIGAAFGDDLAQGIAYTAGKSKEMRDIPRDIRKDAAGNVAAFVGATGVEHGGGAAGRRVAGKVASTKPGYQAALMLKRLMSKY